MCRFRSFVILYNYQNICFRKCFSFRTEEEHSVNNYSLLYLTRFYFPLFQVTQLVTGFTYFCNVLCSRVVQVNESL
jgi:hypothetical protein